MSKVKFIAVSVALRDGCWASEYIDDKGRVWERGHDGDNFKLIESPDEPE